MLLALTPTLSQREREEYLSLPALSQREREYLLFAI
jgi:hypothetical protein